LSPLPPPVPQEPAAVEEDPEANRGITFGRFAILFCLIAMIGYFVYGNYINVGTVLIETDDRVAEIEFLQDGKSYRVTPGRRIELPSGTYEVILRAKSPGYELDRKAINVEAGREVKLKVTKPAPWGT
jgi:hypothetical protein